jgi:hypothetical protein
MMAVFATVHSPALVKTAPAKSAAVKTAPAKSSSHERPAAHMAAAPAPVTAAPAAAPREHGGSSERNRHGKSCQRRGDFPQG